MRTRLQICVLFLSFLVLVAAAKPDRYVKDNVLYSIHPKLHVKVDPKFQYLGRLDYVMEQPSPDRVQINSYDTKSYIFANGVNNQLKEAVCIQMRREQTKYVGNLLGDVKTNLRSGICNLGETEYQCFTRVIYLSPNEPIVKFISEHGFILPDCVMSRTYARADLSLGTYLIVIAYLEDLSQSAFSCQSWQAIDRLTEEHEQYLAQFEHNCRASFHLDRKGFLQEKGSKAYEKGGSMLEKMIQPRDLP